MPIVKPASANPNVQALIRSAEAGAAEAAQELGEKFRTGDGVKPDLAKALHWYRVGAELGDAEAQNNLGTMLLNGVGCQADAAASVPWYRAAAEQGNAVAQFNLGLRYLHGSGVDPDDRTGGEWIAAAAEQGYIDAIGELGTLYRFGRGIAPDLVYAAHLHVIAAHAGDATSHGNLSSYRGELMELALSRNQSAAFSLCRMYGFGLGGETDPAKCWAWIRWAHERCAAGPQGPAISPDLPADIVQAVDPFRRTLSAEAIEQGDRYFVEWVNQCM